MLRSSKIGDEDQGGFSKKINLPMTSGEAGQGSRNVFKRKQKAVFGFLPKA